MELYETLCHRWSQIWSRFESAQQDKLNVLLSVGDDVQIRANVELLLGFGDCGLCHVLKKDEDKKQLVLVDGLSHDVLWKRAILERVRVEESDWFAVYNRGFFDSLEWFLF